MEVINKEFVKAELFKVCETILSYAEVAIPTETQYKKYRSKVLRVINDVARSVEDNTDGR